MTHVAETGATSPAKIERGKNARELIVMEGVWKYYSSGALHRDKGPLGLRNVSVSLSEGELVCISGRSGQGKTTLLRILALDDQLTSGKLSILGQDISDLAANDLDNIRSAAIHYIPQKHLGLLPRTAAETVAYWLMRLDGVGEVEAGRRAFAALEAVGLPAHKFHQRVDKGFSGGEGARVALASAFARNRPICLADEVFAGLDLESAIPLIGLFRELCRRGTAVAIIVHQPELRPYFDRVLTVDNKELVEDKRNRRPKKAALHEQALSASGDRLQGSLECAECGHYEAASELYCRHCFAPLRGYRICPCGSGVLPADAVFCNRGRCGRRVLEAVRMDQLQ